jgi:hypothetical protein
MRRRRPVSSVFAPRRNATRRAEIAMGNPRDKTEFAHGSMVNTRADYSPQEVGQVPPPTTPPYRSAVRLAPLAASTPSLARAQ